MTVIAGGGGTQTAFFSSVNAAGASGFTSATGAFGIRFQTGATPLTVTDLGRWVPNGTTTAVSHTLQLVKSDGSSMGETILGPQAVSGFRYAPLATPVTLAANTSYYLVSSESVEYDNWYSCIPVTVTAGAGGSVQGATYNLWGGLTTTGCAVGTGNVPVNFLYTSGGGGGGVTVTPSGTQVLSPGMNKVFTAVVAGGGTVTWSPLSVPAAQGSVSISGNTLTYTAPATTVANLNLTFTATAGGFSGTGSVQVAAPGISLTDVRRVNSSTGMTAPYGTLIGAPLLLTATVSGLAAGANANVSWQVVSGMPTVASLSPAQVLSGTATTFTPSATLGGLVTLRYCSVADPLKCGDVNIQVTQSGNMQLRPQNLGAAGSVLPPYSQLDFGLEYFGLPVETSNCTLSSASLGTLQQITVVGFPKGYRFTAGYNAGPQTLSGTVVCTHSMMPAGWSETFPVGVSPALGLLPSITLSPNGTGSTTQFRGINVMLTQNGNPGYVIEMEMKIVPSGQSFTDVNGCSFTGGISTSGALAYVFPLMRNDANTGNVAGPTQFQNLWEPGVWENTQCALSASQSSALQSGSYPYHTIQVVPSFRYKTPYVGVHNVWGKVNNGAGYSSGWLPATGMLTVQ